jgi:hypothetical protein
LRAVQLAFVFQLPTKLKKAHITNSFGEFMISHHPFDIQILYPNNAVILGEIRRDFMQCVFADVGYFSM